MTAEQTLYLIVYILFQLLKITLSALAVWFTVRTLIRKYGGRFCGDRPLRSTAVSMPMSILQ